MVATVATGGDCGAGDEGGDGCDFWTRPEGPVAVAAAA